MKQFVILFILLQAFFFKSNAQFSSSYLSINGDTSMVCQSSVQLRARTFSKHSWSSVSLGSIKTIYDFSFVNDSVGYGGGTQGAILKTTDAGNSWSVYDTGSSLTFLAIKAIDNNHVVAFASNGVVYRSSDAGATWGQTIGLSSATFKCVTIQSYDTIFVSSGSVLYKTVDGGHNWTKQTFPDMAIASLCFITSKTGFLGTYGARIYKTTDGGNSWKGTICTNVDFNQVISWPFSSINSISFRNSKKGIAVGSYNQMYYTYDGGNTWSLNSELYRVGRSSVYEQGVLNTDSTLVLTAATLNYVKFVDSEVGYVKGYRAGLGFVLKTVDGGKSWKWIYASKTNKVQTAYFNSEFRGYINGGASNVLLMSAINLPDKGKYRWEPAEGLSNPDIANPVLTTPAMSGNMYSVTRTEGDFETSMFFYPDVSGLRVITASPKHIGCTGSTVLDSIVTNYKGNELLRYKWTPSTGLDNDTLCNPVASPRVNTTYTLTVTGPTGCSAQVSLPVIIDPLSVKTMAAKTLIAGGSVIMDSVTTNYSGSGRLRYKWSPAIGLSSDTVASPVVSPKATTTYTVTVTAPTGCTASANVVVNVSPLTVDVTNNLNTTCGNPAQLGVLSTNYTGTAALKYKWTPSAGLDNDSIASPKATVTVATTYTLTITTANGATATDKVVVTPVGLNAPSISYVAIGNANKNVVNWNKSTDGTVSYYKLYKETNVTNSYSLVGTVSASAATTFTDTTSTPDVQSNKYKLSLVDACGIETSMSAYHKTMHLTINKGVGTVWNLIWEQYEGFSVATYYIYRGQTSGNISLIGSLSGSNTQFSDYTAPSGDVYYQIEAVSSALSAVRSSGRSLVNAGALVYTSRSNIATNSSGANGIDDLHNVSINLVPNPANNAVVVNFDAAVSERMQLQVFNSVGQAVMSVSSVSSGQKVQIGSLTEGIYTVVLKSGNYSGKQKLVVAK